MGDIYSAADVVNKTLVAAKDLKVYDAPRTGAKEIGFIKKGQPAGVVYSYLDANPALGRSGLWWQFVYGNSWYYIPHAEGAFSVSALRQQGVLSTEEKLEEEKDMPWYEALIKKYGIWIAGIYLAATAIKGNLSRPR